MKKKKKKQKELEKKEKEYEEELATLIFALATLDQDREELIEINQKKIDDFNEYDDTEYISNLERSSKLIEKADLFLKKKNKKRQIITN